MAFLGRKTANVLLTILFFASVLVIVYMARAVLAIFCLSILFAYLIDPVVSFLDRHSLLRGKARGVHIAEAYLGVLILVAGTVYVLIPQASSRPGVFLQNVASFSDRLGSGEIATEVGHTNGWSEAQTLRAKEFLTSHRETIRKVSSQIQGLAAMILSAGAVMPILAIFFLADGRRLAEMALATFATEENLDRLQSLSRELNSVLRHYIRAKMTLVGLSLTYVSSSLLVLRYPHALGPGNPRRRPGVHSDSGMDNRRNHHHHLRYRHAQSLDMDGCPAGYLDNSHRLLDRPARSWGRVGDAPGSRDIHADGGRCRWRICRRLSRFTERSNCSSHLAKAWQFARSRKACVAGRGHCSGASGRVLTRAEKERAN